MKPRIGLRALLREAFRRLGDEPCGEQPKVPERTDADRVRMKAAVLAELARRERERAAVEGEKTS